MSFLGIDFKAIWALLSCDYFQTIVNSLITLSWHISSSSSGPGTKIYWRGIKWGVYRDDDSDDASEYDGEVTPSQWFTIFH